MTTMNRCARSVGSTKVHIYLPTHANHRYHAHTRESGALPSTTTFHAAMTQHQGNDWPVDGIRLLPYGQHIESAYIGKLSTYVGKSGTSALSGALVHSRALGCQRYFMCLGTRIVVAASEGSAPRRPTETKITVAYLASFSN